MGNFSITSLDGGLITVTIFLVQAVKKHCYPRWVPVLPFVFSWILIIPAIIITRNGVPPFAVFVSEVFLEGLKVAVLAMAAYKVHFTTIKGKDSAKKFLIENNTGRNMPE